ncbi:head GIN domain-containing protein [Daejeonella lutea]|uniref:Putative auto-transporter adhesin, head GIN domain n=1 Tax=Daejeonella lutea TaxID=572036 RepID=A0A1T5DHW0_9SPHI|nr:head GIN domain-containing protein [Daejeonella lutea]SKB71227.1 Putative auto-transporter adhesin, head GIN domain [Daejeonella lutea]
MRTILFIAILSLLSISCTKDRLTADGNIISDVRQPGTFTGVSSSGSNPITIAYGSTYKVEIRGSANLIPRYKTEIHNGVINLGYEHVNVHNDDIEVFVTLPALNKAAMSGSGRLWIDGNFPAQDLFRLSISGSSKTNVRGSFTANEVNVDISGSGDVQMENIIAKKGDVRISGSGDVRMNVQNTLKARISGSGKVYYTGNATVDSEVSGSGQVIKF